MADNERAPLRRIWNPPNPYLSAHREFLEQPPVAELEVWEDRSKSILSHNDSPDLGFRWSVNPYRGCFHACAYCYARPSHEYLGLGAGTDFERKILVKPEAAALLDAAFRKKSWKRELVMLSGVTDCYQPLEAAWGLTRACLEVCERHANPVSVVTKSALVRRDRDLLARIASKARVHVSMSIPFLDEETSRRVEPGAPTVARRFEAIRDLAAAGVRVGIGVAPIIPGLNDRDVPHLLERAKESGASFAFRTLLRLPGSVREVFLHRIRETMPGAARRIENRIRDVRGGELSDERFGRRFRGTGRYWEAIDTLWDLWLRRTGLDDMEAYVPREDGCAAPAPRAPRETMTGPATPGRPGRLPRSPSEAPTQLGLPF
jgi:DNA repair photolyase